MRVQCEINNKNVEAQTAPSKNFKKAIHFSRHFFAQKFLCFFEMCALNFCKVLPMKSATGAHFMTIATKMSHVDKCEFFALHFHFLYASFLSFCPQ
ncbi:hypothetical protein DOE51_02240 [Bdellovibrio sp. NC01]|nr:hypothetical protein DOE51_02240 [Bdellovibrio sp. NC01]